MTIDWTKPELYQHVDGRRIAKVHVLPEWCDGDSYLVYVKWTDGIISTYTIDGMQFVGDARPSVIPREPRAVEGWMDSLTFCQHCISSPVFFRDKSDGVYVRVRITEVIE